MRTLRDQAPLLEGKREKGERQRESVLSAIEGKGRKVIRREGFLS